MGTTVKGRAYDGSGRRSGARATKAAVVSTAHRLFVEHGYPATTVNRIADEAEVGAATVYRLFGSKRALLKEVLDVALGGDDEAVEVQHRPELRAAFDAETPAAMLAAFVHVLRLTLERSAPLQHVLLTSAAVDPEAAELLEVTRQQRHTGQSRIVAALGRSGDLRPGLEVTDAADVVYALMSPELFRILTIERGWSLDAYEAWLAGSLCDQLLTPQPPDGG
jgi:AcrR family transcriptional regulator